MIRYDGNLICYQDMDLGLKLRRNYVELFFMGRGLIKPKTKTENFMCIEHGDVPKGTLNVLVTVKGCMDSGKGVLSIF